MSEIKTISKCLGQAADGSIWFWCAGCDTPHNLNVGSGSGPRWGYNGNAEVPTFTPSVLVQHDQWEPAAITPDIAEKIRIGEIVQIKATKVCHSFITEGRIQYLSDCTHHLGGQTVDLPNWEESWARW
ncbi:ammonia monooxygenase [Pseudomonas sp. FFUP_PS_473]|uniref:DUF6527 family protein n=1 Tax=Pseudomonas sp. FFUP_PS_473 TaxID=2060418 RepID=UPI000C7C0E99|nr:DUF6527 family protein [Pseudomonas sp. FFUP_PS_473]PLP87600.1 ammonia monooxygenase [Pseudomonas sp. FFUP_PS_473]